MAVQGVFASNEHIVGNRVGDFASSILNLFPTGNAPLLALSSGMPDEAAMDVIVNWFEENRITGRAATVSGGTTTTVVVDDGSSYVPSTLLLVEDTGEVILVTANDGNNSLTVIRAMAGTTNTSIDNSMHTTRIGNAHEEGSSMPSAVVNQGAPRTNYVQIFRNVWAITGTAKAVQVRTGDQLAKNKREAMQFHSEDMERAFFWGKKHIGTLNGKQLRISDGIENQIRTFGGVVDTLSGGNFKHSEFRETQRQIFANNIKGQPNERITYCGDKAMLVMTEAARLDNTAQFSSMETDFGLRFTIFHSPFGKLSMITHPLMNENPFYQNTMYILHPGAIKKRTLRKTRAEDYNNSGSGTKGVDADEGVLTTETCMTLAAGKVHGIIENIVTPLAS